MSFCLAGPNRKDSCIGFQTLFFGSDATILSVGACYAQGSFIFLAVIKNYSNDLFQQRPSAETAESPTVKACLTQNKKEEMGEIIVLDPEGGRSYHN